jgi:hypothetical protein
MKHPCKTIIFDYYEMLTSANCVQETPAKPTFFDYHEIIIPEKWLRTPLQNHHCLIAMKLLPLQTVLRTPLQKRSQWIIPE